MGLTKASVGTGAVDSGLVIKKQNPTDRVVALAGIPNVGKSTVFNGLTGLNQHTGNWPGKTVANAQGMCKTEKHNYILVDIPGTYSLLAHSAEEEVARNFICFGKPDTVAVICDATCIERSLNLVLQVLEITPNVMVCVNLADEARRKGIKNNLKLISERLGVPIVSTAACKKKSLGVFLKTLDKVSDDKNQNKPYKVTYPKEIEKAISIIEPTVRRLTEDKINSRWLSLKLIDGDQSILKEIDNYFGEDFLKNPNLFIKLEEAEKYLQSANIDKDKLKDLTVSALISASEEICRSAVTYENSSYANKDRKIDKLLTGRFTAFPFMLLLLAFVFWLTITGANYPSQMLSNFFFWLEGKITLLFEFFNAPSWLYGALVLGVYRVTAWVVSVMLPPMAIFFPLFTLLEDIGYLPRIAYNLDKPFKYCNACGKQSLTMCMGFGCNAAGIVGCRIIDSPRERLLAILTNNFVPCNGRFPALITIISMFFVSVSLGFGSSLLSATILTLVILLGVIATFVITKVLSVTMLKGVPTSFTLELPPFRKPQICKLLIRSIFDRTLFVLGRAVAVAAPAGLIIWLMANITVSGTSLLSVCADYLDPFAKILGLDGVILMAFILGFPANEIVIPIIIMAYTASGSLAEIGNLTEVHNLFVSNGWTVATAVSVMLFSLMHWPCSTSLLTVKKETGSIKWTVIAALIPTITGMAVCIVFNLLYKLFA